MATAQLVIDRLFAKVDWPPVLTACWPWTATLSRGYGTLRVGSRTDGSMRMAKAYRLAYELAVGPIPPNAEIDHLCRNPRCINPMHLEAVSKSVNILRGESFSAVNARKSHCKRGHAFTPENTYLFRGRVRICRKCKALRQKSLTV